MPNKIWNFRIDEAQLDELRAIQQRDGIPVAEQIRRAVKQWIETRPRPTPAPKKGKARKRRT